MSGAIFGVDGIIILVGLIVGIAGLAVPIWALVDAGSKPSRAFDAAGSSKGMWMALIIVFWLLTGIVGLVLAIVYLASVRPRVTTAMAQASSGYGVPAAGAPGYWNPASAHPPPAPVQTAPPGWYPDSTTQKTRWWDGTQWGPTAPE